MYPLKFQPIYKERVWGGAHIAAMFGRETEKEKIGESWELACHPHGMSVVANGEFTGKTLQELVACYKTELLGQRWQQAENFPLLLKILDANEPLSVQVHPSDAYPGLADGESGKHEAWYVLAAAADARIVYGLNEHVKKQDVIAALETGRIMDILHVVPVRTGDMIVVPAGVIHALLGGIVVCEIQQNSDTTYRVYDYDRLGDDGRPRALHTDKALEVIDFDFVPQTDFTAHTVSCEYFSMTKHVVAGQSVFKPAGQFIVLFIVSGSGQVNYKDYCEDIAAGEAILLPACLDEVVIHGNLTMLSIS